MSVVQVLQQEIKDSELSISRTYEESVYKRDLKKRIELINWVLQNMKILTWKFVVLLNPG